MKSIEQVQSEEFGDVYTLEQFADMVEEGGIMPYDGNGYFHDGEKKTDVSVWTRNLTWDDIKNCPYVVWYNR